jgi:hypothetical protein
MKSNLNKVDNTHSVRVYGLIGQGNKVDKCADVNINYVYNRDPSYDLYTGCMNVLDRDYWNETLEKRNYLISRPPVFHKTRPQSTSWCNFKRTGNKPIISNPKLIEESKKYHTEYLSKYPTKGLGIPTYTYPNKCPAAQMCNQQISLGNNSDFSGFQEFPYMQNRRDVEHMYNNVPRFTYPMSVNSVNINIDSDSALKRLDHYCPTDIRDSRMTTRDNNNKNSIDSYIPNGFLSNTSCVWNNTTRVN